MMVPDASEQQEESTLENRIEILLSEPVKKLGLDNLANKDPANSMEEHVNRPTLKALVNLTPCQLATGSRTLQQYSLMAAQAWN